MTQNLHTKQGVSPERRNLQGFSRIARRHRGGSYVDSTIISPISRPSQAAINGRLHGFTGRYKVSMWPCRSCIPGKYYHLQGTDGWNEPRRARFAVRAPESPGERFQWGGAA